MVLAVMVACAATASAASAEVWTQMTPRPGCPDVPELRGVGASSAADVWAVGENDGNASMPVAAHWDGTAWQEMVSGNLEDDGHNGGLIGVSALSTSDAWAVGWQDTPESGALAVFWNGSDWSVVPTPAPASGRRVLQSVSMLTPSNVWAVGYKSAGRPLAEHWNGTRWSVVATPGAQPLRSVKAVSASNVWALGGHLVEHYDGARWATVAVPITSTTNLGQITRIPGTTHLWVVGTDGATKRPVAIYYNGTSWKAHNPPGAGELDGVAALSANDVWASGTSLTAPSNVTFHWTGSAWHAVAPAGLADGWVENMTRAPGSTQLWAVGMAISTAGNSNPFAAYYH